MRAALAAAPLVIDRGPEGLAALVGSTGLAPAEAVAGVDTPGLRQIAVLVDETPVTGMPPDSRLRIVPPGEVWPPAAAIAVAPALAEPSPVAAALATTGRRG